MIDSPTTLSGGAVMLTLIPVSILFGLVALWVFRRCSPQHRIRETRRRIAGHLYELRLFTDEPALVWKAQTAVLRYTFLHVGLMLLPAVVMAIPGVLLFLQLDAVYGHAPLAVGKAAVVTAHLADGIVLATAPVLQAPDGIALETAGVRAAAEREISWRVRPLRASDGVLRMQLASVTAEKRIRSGVGPRYVSQRRVRGWWELLWHPNESRLAASGVDWIEIQYPRASVSWMGLNLSWIVWFFIFSGLTVLLLRRRFGVTL